MIVRGARGGKGAGHALTVPCRCSKAGDFGGETPGASITSLLLLRVGLRRCEKEKPALGKGQVRRMEDQKSNVIFACPICLPKATGKLTGGRRTKPGSSNELEPGRHSGNLTGGRRQWPHGVSPLP